jgi:hypothetical protein
MKRVVLLALLALALPMAAWADSNIDIGNFGGTLSVSTSGVTLTNSTVLKIGPTMGSNLGTVSLTTGAFSGSLATGGTFGAGTFTITGNGTGGFPNGVIFSGTFTDITWTKLGNHNFILSGTLDGTWFNGTHFSGGTSQVVFKGKSFQLSSGDTSLSVPEPGTLGLLGTGLVGIAGLIRRKLNLGS